MPRQTRAALRAQQDIHVDETLFHEAQSTPLPATPNVVRSPLSDIAPNSVEESTAVAQLAEDMVATGKKTKAPSTKKGKSVKKGAKKQATAFEDALEDETRPEVLEDERLAAASPASDAAREELMSDVVDSKDRSGLS